MKVTIGVDIGGTNVRLVACDEAQKVVSQLKGSSRGVFTSQEDAGKRLATLIQKFSESIENCEIEAVSIGFPATLDRDRTEVISAPNVPSLNHLRCDEIAERLGVPVFFEKDAAMLLYNDMLLLGLETKGILLAIYAGTGLGNAIMIDGKLLNGANGAACELGHIAVFGGQRKCGCGNEGCLEEYGAGKALERIVRENYPETSIGDLFAEKGEEKELLEFIEHLSIAIATEITIFDPDTVILGGGVLNMKSFPTARLEEYVRKHIRKPQPRDDLTFHYSTNETFGGARGAAIFAAEKVRNI